MTRNLVSGELGPFPSRLPIATSERWQPIRGGLLNLYLYDNEEFRYEKGHLILRGNNGTGKSRVMALQLPFLFDGHLSPSRVEPDADPAKRMEWNLLMGRHNERLGYTWIEFGQVAKAERNGNPIEANGQISRASNIGSSGGGNEDVKSQLFVTLGCGLSATKGSGMRDPWFFITDQRVGVELFLQSDAGHALSRSALAQAIGTRGQVYTTAKDYREAVDNKLFGLGKQRYDAMVDLLIQLRRPQLSRQLDEKMLASVLGEALPPPSEQMIIDVAESFRGLESDRMELTRFRSACDGVDSFLKVYQHYACIASRRRAGDVRQSHSRYESANKELRQAEREHFEASELRVTATDLLHSLEIRHAELEGRIETLRADPKMRSADSISQAENEERQTLEDLQLVGKEVETSLERTEQKKTVQTQSQQRAESQLKATLDVYRRSTEIAGSCDLQSKHEAAFTTLKLQSIDASANTAVGDPRLVRTGIEAICKTLARSLEQLRKRNEALTNAEQGFTSAKAHRDDAQSSVTEAIENECNAEQRRYGAVHDFLDSYEMWRRDSDELTLPAADEIAANVEQWSQQIEEGSPVAKVAREAELDARERLHSERSRLLLLTEALSTERYAAEQLLAKLEGGFCEAPSLPIHASAAGRATRPGAPFWSIVDFSPACQNEIRANIEAALEASGILSAWVAPDGSVLADDFADVLFAVEATSESDSIESLAQVLVADMNRDDAGRTVSDDVVCEVLRRIGYGEQNSNTWIAPNGRWRNGPLYGSSRKEFSQFIGKDSREAERTRQITAIQEELERIGDRAIELQQGRESLDNKGTVVERQVLAAPTDSTIRAAATALSITTQRLTECRQALTRTEQIVAERRMHVESAQEKRDLDARDLGLFSWIHRLNELDASLNNYQLVLAALWPSIDHFETLRSQCAAAVAAVCEAEQDAKLLREKQHNQTSRHAKAKERLKTLQETVGVEAAEILRDLGSAIGRRDGLAHEVKQAREQETKAIERVARMEERIKSRSANIDGETARRQQTCVSFQQLCALGLLKIATAVVNDENPFDWSVTRTVEVARQTELASTEVNADDSAWDRVQESVTARIQELNTALSQHSFTSTLLTSDNLYRVTVPYQGRDRSIHELRELLSEEVQQRQLILDEREREIIENHLIGEVAAKLHEQIHQAYKLVDLMNAEIQERPMSTGMTLKFDWKPDEDLSSGIVEMCKKLLAATGTWSPSERSAIGRFLQDHIKDVRASREMGTWQDHLSEALDYRRWHRFWVMRKQETGWKRLTKRTHGTGSGGEKAVALTIPQFAAAAAHYSSARDDAPRLILLDEAFAGIDPDMRGKCMELISVFDLDFLMTSEIEWGCYPGLPGVAIHQLSTRSGYDAVFLTRWIWNGKQRIKDERQLPPASRPSL